MRYRNSRTGAWRRFMAAAAIACALASCSDNRTTKGSDANAAAPLNVALAPYQDIAILVNIKNLQLERKYATRVEFTTLPWEDIPGALVSAGQTIDVGPVSITDYLSKVENMNKEGSDPLVLIYPMYLFRGGGFISFNPRVPALNAGNIKDKELVKRFLSFHIGLQKTSANEMLIAKLARDAGVPLSSVHTSETTINDGLLACENGSLDMAGCGLTQREEALKRHGRVVLRLDDLGLGDLDMFACKLSTYRKRKKDIDNLVRMWYDCTDYVFSDLDHHTAYTLAYLEKYAATKYDLAGYKKAVGDEYFARTLPEAQKDFVDAGGKYSVESQSKIVLDYLHDIGTACSIHDPPKLCASFSASP